MPEAAGALRSRHDAYDQLRHQMLDALKERSLDADNQAHAQAISDLASDVVERYQREARTGLGSLALANPPDMVARLIRSVINWGVLTELLERRDVEEIFIRGRDVWYLDASGGLQNIEEPTTEGELAGIVNRLLRTAGRTVDQRVAHGADPGARGQRPAGGDHPAHRRCPVGHHPQVHPAQRDPRRAGRAGLADPPGRQSSSTPSWASGPACW